MPHESTSFKIQERLFRRLRREPAIKLLTAQIRPDAPLKLFTVNRVLSIWAGGSVEQWYGTLGDCDRTDPHFSLPIHIRSHISSLTWASDYRRWRKPDEARRLVALARKIRLDRGPKWRHLP